MKRPYRTAPFGKMFGENFASAANYTGRSPFAAAQSPYVPYPRYDSAGGGAWMTTSGHLSSYPPPPPCSSRPVVYPYSTALSQPATGMAINTYGSLANNIGELIKCPSLIILFILIYNSISSPFIYRSGDCKHDLATTAREALRLLGAV